MRERIIRGIAGNISFGKHFIGILRKYELVAADCFCWFKSVAIINHQMVPDG